MSRGKRCRIGNLLGLHGTNGVTLRVFRTGDEVPPTSAAEMLESALIFELAIDDFDRALKYVRGMPEGQVRMSGLLALVEASRRPF